MLIVWVNVAKGNPKHSAALQSAYKEQADVVCIQEPWARTGTKTVNHPGYDSHAPTGGWDATDKETFERERPRVLIYTRKGAGLQVEPRLTMEDRDMMWVDVNGYAILNVYRDRFSTKVLEYVTGLDPPPRCIVGGDFNARHDTFEPGSKTMRGGADIARWATQSGMEFIGTPGASTHKDGHVLDLTFSNIPFARTRVQDHMNSGSDHYTQLTVVPGRGRSEPDRYHYRVPESELPRFANAVAQDMRLVPDPWQAESADEIDMCISLLTHVITEALHVAGKPGTPVARSAPWWTPECRKAYKAHLRAQAPGTTTQETRDFLTTVRKAKRDYWRHVTENLQTDEDLFRIIGWHKLEPQRRQVPLVVDGVTYTTPKEKAEALRSSILCRYSAEDDLENPPAEQDNPKLPWRTHVTPEEVERNTTGVSSTSPGTDRTTVRLLKACWEHVRHTVRGIYQKCLELSHYPSTWKLAEVAMIPKVGKKDRTSPRSWRPIALLSCLGKGLERILARRIAWTAMTRGVLSPQHAGALPKRSCMDLVAAFTHEVEMAFSKGMRVTMVTMDVQGAFDALLKNRLLHRMKEQGWPTAALRMIQSFLTDRQVQVRLGKETTAAHDVPCGTPQGSPLSPVLYMLYLAELLNQDRKLRFGYADDICLYRASHSLDKNVEQLAEDVRNIQSWGEQNKVAFAPEKLEMIHLTKQRDSHNPPIRVSDDLEIHPVQAPTDTTPALRWLGVYFDRKLTFKKHVEIRAAKARKVGLHMRGLAKTTYGPPADALRKAVITCVLPRITYGCEAWYGGRTKPPRIMREARPKEVSCRLGWHITTVERALALSARAVLPAYRTTPTTTLFRDSGLPSGVVALEQAKLRFALRLATIDTDHLLTARAQIPVVDRGRGAGQQQQPRTIVQRVGRILPSVHRTTLAEPHYTTGSRSNPTLGQKKKQAAKAFMDWWEKLPPEDVSVFSDGSEQRLEGTRHVTYGYAIYQQGQKQAEGRGSLNNISHVFDAEAVGAWRGLSHATRYNGLRSGRIWLCIDSTSVIWGMRGDAPPSSQWAFRNCHGVMEVKDVGVKWAPGHTKIPGNEEADRLANLEAQRPHAPTGLATLPTVSGIRSECRRLLRAEQSNWWAEKRRKLSTWYREWGQTYDYKAPAELSLRRATLGKLQAIRTKHGDFKWYHQKYNHQDADLQCRCGQDKTPDHIVHCKWNRRLFRFWPAAPPWPPSSTIEGKTYLKHLLNNPDDFQAFLELTGKAHCPRSTQRDASRDPSVGR